MSDGNRNAIIVIIIVVIIMLAIFAPVELFPKDPLLPLWRALTGP